MADAWARTLENSTALAVHSETLAYALAFENPKLDLGNRFNHRKQSMDSGLDHSRTGGSKSIDYQYS